MNPGQIILNIVIMSVGVVFMAFTKKCFTGLCFMTYFSLMGGMLAVYGFIETLFGALMPKKTDATMTLTAGMRRRETEPEGAVEEMLGGESMETTMIGRINASLLKNPWIGQFLERDHFGLGQVKGSEPKAMIMRMEKYGLACAAMAAGGALWMGWRFNPGLLAAGFAIGFFVPHINARKDVALRHRRALMNLPSFVDLLALTIESGLDYLNSMDKILGTTFKNKGPLEEEIENVLKQIQLGFPRRDALRNMAKRVDVPEIRSLVGLLIQSDELGTGLVQLLRNFSHDMRNRRTGKAEEMAGKASTKMLGPMMIFIFPVIFALILAPFGMSLVKGGGMSF